MLIAIEGTDAAGKNTMAKMLVERLDRLGRAAVMYSFPRYETDIGKAIRRHLMNETMMAELGPPIKAPLNIPEYMQPRVHSRAPEDALVFQTLMTTDKYDATPEIKKALQAGTIVVCDRWISSAVAFGMADGLSATWLWGIQAHLPSPHLNIFLRVSEEEALRRRPKLRDRYETDRAKQAVVRMNYERIWTEKPLDGAWTVIDADGPSVEAVHEAVWAQVRHTHNATFTFRPPL